MVKFTGLLANLVKVVKFVVLGVEDDSSEENNVLRIEIAEEQEVTGSNVLPNGAAMKLKSNIIFVGGEDIEAFQKGLKKEEVDGKEVTIYEGDLKLDVARPKTRMENGKAVIVKPPRLWLTSVRFNKKGNGLRQESKEKGQDAILALFKQAPMERKTVTAPANKDGVEVTAESED